jgi:F-box/leucine-rich repeat protein 2/20
VRAVLLGCPKLRETDLAHSARISNELRVEVAALCNFSRLQLSEWDEISDELALQDLSVCPNLTELDCSYCGWVAHTLAVCAQHCPLLESVSLQGCNNVTNNDVRTLVAACGSRLCRLDLTDCQRLGDEAVLAVAEHCPRLLEIKCPFNVSDAAVVALAGCCQQLTSVFLSLSTVRDPGVTALAAHCPKLTCIVLHGCCDVTMQGVHALAENCRLLSRLQLPRHLAANAARIGQLWPTTCTVSFW